jgi:hypothetical protein
MPQPRRRTSGSARASAPKAVQQGPPAQPPRQAKYEVDLPAGGRLELKSAEEVRMWEDSAKRYIQDYGLVKANDLMLLGAILSQGIAMFRAQQELSDPKSASKAVTLISKASEQIRELEKALGIDKKTREAGGQHNVADYVTNLKRAAHAKGIHIAERVKMIEAFAMGLRWRLRLLENGDDEDRAYHGLTHENVVKWAAVELAKIEEHDKKFAKEKGATFVGRL